MSVRHMTRKQTREFLTKQAEYCELLYYAPNNILYLSEDQTTILLCNKERIGKNNEPIDVIHMLNVNASYKMIDEFLNCIDLVSDDVFNILNLISALFEVILDNKKYDINHYE